MKANITCLCRRLLKQNNIFQNVFWNIKLKEYDYYQSKIWAVYFLYK